MYDLTQYRSIRISNGNATWQFVNEGAANIVFRCVGNAGNHGDLDTLEAKVIRLNKGLLVDMNNCGHLETLIEGNKYTRHVMVPLLGSEYVDCGEIVTLSGPDVVELMTKADSARAQKRKIVHSLSMIKVACQDILLVPALLMTDFTQLSISRLPSSISDVRSSSMATDIWTFSVELKPKWGFLPHSDFIHPTNRVKREVCRFCMHQLYKHAKGDIPTPSRYCPLDLFSGSVVRIRRALYHLVKNPQNNFQLSYSLSKTQEAITAKSHDQILQV